jgi:hypothetical protein
LAHAYRAVRKNDIVHEQVAEQHDRLCHGIETEFARAGASVLQGDDSKTTAALTTFAGAR